jgi:hypothetical protein
MHIRGEKKIIYIYIYKIKKRYNVFQRNSRLIYEEVVFQSYIIDLNIYIDVILNI